MRKLRLDLADLHVDSFPVVASRGDGRGTVLARNDTIGDDTCFNYSVCAYATCFNTYQCESTVLVTVGCTNYCEHGPGWTQDCPDQEPPVTG